MPAGARDDPAGAAQRGPAGQLRERRPECLHELGRGVAGDADGQGRPRIHRPRELLHVVERDRVDAGDRAERACPYGVPAKMSWPAAAPCRALLRCCVRRSCVERVQLRVLEARKSSSRKPGVEQLRRARCRRTSASVLVDDARERRHLLVDMGVEACRPSDRGLRRSGRWSAPSSPPSAIMRRRQGGKALLARRIVGGAGREEQLDVELRQHRNLRDECARPGCAGSGARPSLARTS